MGPPGFRGGGGIVSNLGQVVNCMLLVTSLMHLSVMRPGRANTWVADEAFNAGRQPQWLLLNVDEQRKSYP